MNPAEEHESFEKPDPLPEHLSQMSEEELREEAKRERKRMEDWLTWEEEKRQWDAEQRRLEEESAQNNARRLRAPTVAGKSPRRASFERLVQKLKLEGLSAAAAQLAAKRVMNVIVEARRERTPALPKPSAIYESRRRAA